jgi:acetyl-CoA acetyltransferase family protein
VAAINNGTFKSEIVPVTIPVRKGEPVVVSRDEHPRDTSLEALAKLPTPFRQGGTVTAGNASGVNDGSCAVLLASEAAAKRFGLTPKARVIGMATAGVPPRIMGIGPAPATRKLLDRLGIKIGDVDVIELNEAFAAQVVPCRDEWGVDPERLNPFGGAIALGHPFGMTGARIMTTLLNDLDALDATIGLETMCVAGGMGQAMIVERLS